MKKIAVVGSGTMGNGIAHVFSLYGYQVHLTDISGSALEKAVNTISTNLDRQIKKEIINQEEKDAALRNLKTSTSMVEAVKQADLVIEAATEDRTIKRELFMELDKHTPSDAIIASNTSSISISLLASYTSKPDKIIGMHFMNPVPVMELVEIISGYNTSEETTRTIVDLSKKINKHPVTVQDYPGFISNRILMPMINEAIFALYEGVSGVSEIDAIMKLGMAHPMGPLQLADFIGLDVCLSILGVMYDGFKNPKYAPCPLLVQMVQAGHLGRKTGHGFYIWTKGSKELVVAPRFC